MYVQLARTSGDKAIDASWWYVRGGTCSASTPGSDGTLKPNHAHISGQRVHVASATGRGPCMNSKPADDELHQHQSTMGHRNVPGRPSSSSHI